METIKNRIEYIDYIKGFAILWIVWYHTTCPAFAKNYWHVPLFFFVSGLFFKKESFNLFFKKRIKNIIIPFFFFYIISYFFRILLYFWDMKEIKTFNYFSFFDVFHWDCCRVDYLSVNVPLWFFICFFIIQLLYWLLLKISDNKIFIFITTLIFFICGKFLEYYEIALPFMIPQAFFNCLYFGFGIVFGKNLIELLKKKKESTLIFLFSIFVFIPLIFIPFSLKPEVTNTIQFFPFLYIVFFVFRNAYQFPPLKLFHFYGINSLVVLGVHVLVQTIYRRILFRFSQEETILSGIIDTILTITTLYFVILFLNKYLPQLIGKSK